MRLSWSSLTPAFTVHFNPFMSSIGQYKYLSVLPPSSYMCPCMCTLCIAFMLTLPGGGVLLPLLYSHSLYSCRLSIRSVEGDMFVFSSPTLQSVEGHIVFCSFSPVRLCIFLYSHDRSIIKSIKSPNKYSKAHAKVYTWTASCHW